MVDEFLRHYVGEFDRSTLHPRFLKVAKVIKYRDNYNTDAELREKVAVDDEDLYVLEREGEWKVQPWALYFAVALNSIAAVIQGWDQESVYTIMEINGKASNLRRFLHHSFITTFGPGT